MQPTVTRKYIKQVCKKYNLREITTHGFRHTHCSFLFESGASIKEVQDRLGHSDIQTTMNIYAHVTKDTKEKLLKCLLIVSAFKLTIFNYVLKQKNRQ